MRKYYSISLKDPLANYLYESYMTHWLGVKWLSLWPSILQRRQKIGDNVISGGSFYTLPCSVVQARINDKPFTTPVHEQSNVLDEEN